MAPPELVCYSTSSSNLPTPASAPPSSLPPPHGSSYSTPRSFCKFEIIKPFKQQLILHTLSQHQLNSHKHNIHSISPPSPPTPNTVKSRDTKISSFSSPLPSQFTASPLVGPDSIKTYLPDHSTPSSLELSPPVHPQMT